jgi:hypothetical protein
MNQPTASATERNRAILARTNDAERLRYQRNSNGAVNLGSVDRSSTPFPLLITVMSTPVVVQGTAVQPDFGLSPSPVEIQSDSDHQPAKTGCKDPLFALLFYVNVIAIVGVAVVYGPDAFDETATVTYEGYVYAALIAVVISLVFSAGGLSILMCIPETMIKVSLIFVVLGSLVWAAYGFFIGSMFTGIIGLIFFALGVCYARAVWGR